MNALMLHEAGRNQLLTRGQDQQQPQLHPEITYEDLLRLMQERWGERK